MQATTAPRKNWSSSSPQNSSKTKGFAGKQLKPIGTNTINASASGVQNTKKAIGQAIKAGRALSGDVTAIKDLGVQAIKVLKKRPLLLVFPFIMPCIGITLILLPLITTVATVNAVKDELVHIVVEAAETGGCVVALANPGTYAADAVGMPGVDGLVGTCFDQLGIAELDRRLGVTSTIKNALPDFGKVPKIKKPSWL